MYIHQSADRHQKSARLISRYSLSIRSSLWQSQDYPMGAPQSVVDKSDWGMISDWFSGSTLGSEIYARDVGQGECPRP